MHKFAKKKKIEKGLLMSSNPVKRNLIKGEIVSALYFGFAKERVKRPFLIRNVPADKITACRGQNVVRGLRIDQAYPTPSATIWLLTEH